MQIQLPRTAAAVHVITYKMSRCRRTGGASPCGFGNRVPHGAHPAANVLAAGTGYAIVDMPGACGDLAHRSPSRALPPAASFSPVPIFASACCSERVWWLHDAGAWSTERMLAGAATSSGASYASQCVGGACTVVRGISGQVIVVAVSRAAQYCWSMSMKAVYTDVSPTTTRPSCSYSTGSAASWA